MAFLIRKLVNNVTGALIPSCRVSFTSIGRRFICALEYLTGDSYFNVHNMFVSEILQLIGVALLLQDDSIPLNVCPSAWEAAIEMSR